jgi:uracil-DNA glycosylase family 4
LISIKSSFANCSVCELLENPSCILETNSKADLSKVEVIFVAENPGKDEVAKKPEPAPLVGRAGKLFRKYFQKFNLNKKKYLLTNVVLCQTLNPDGTTGNPEQDVIDRCKVNCMELIKACNPKLVVLMGTSPMSAFGIAKSGITSLHGQLFEWEGYKLFLTVHPSFVNRNPSFEQKFEEDIAKVAELMGEEHIEIKAAVEAKTLGKGMFRYKIPEKFYTDEYRLIDIQFLNRRNQVLYIFRDKNNKKIYHTENDDFVCYQVPEGVPARKLMPFDQLKQIVIKNRDTRNLDYEITYEGDVRITTKHAMDYYHFNKGEPRKTHPNIMFCDIEIDTGDLRVFPNQKEAKFPINMITTILNGKTITYVIDNKTEPIKDFEGVELKIFKNEKKMMRQFIKDFKESDPDFMSGWNFINFDMDYIYNRLPQIGIPQGSISIFDEFYVDGSKYICHLPGCVVLDQEFLYRTFTFTKMENYKLGFISSHELGVTKIQLPLPMNEMYWKMLNLTIEYNIRDTQLLEQLEDKLQHINLMNELRIICNAGFDSGSSSFGQIDSLMVSYLKNEKNIASKNSNLHIKKEKYPGAFVFEPTPGIYNHITDFDFASLYPSLMITYNIGVNSYVMKTKEPTLGYELAYNQKNLPDMVEVYIDPLYENKLMKVPKADLLKKMKDENLVYTINGCFFKPHKKDFSVFGEVVDMLMKSRKEYKNQMFDAIEAKDKEHENFFYTRQLVYKVLANTLYGVVANKAFRFFDVSLAGAITLSGQEVLKTSIIEGDAFMRHLDSGKPYTPPAPLTKQEFYSDVMPGRSNEYIVTGDTDSIFCRFENFKQEKSVKNIHAWCAQIEDFLNNNKMIDVVKKHNVDLDFNRMVLKNELVISRGLFLAKKRYAIRVINNEGKDVDKINYMGVEIKRSDYPSKSKEFLSTLSELILKSEKVSINKLLDYVNSQERDFIELIKAGDKSIARPVSYGKKLSDYKTIPQGVRAMEAWNSIMYDIHKTGAKSYMYWVNGIDYQKAPEDVILRYEKWMAKGNKLEVIAIPDEEARLPEFFVPDVKGAMQFSFIDRYELMLQPLTDVKMKETMLTM